MLAFNNKINSSLDTKLFKIGQNKSLKGIWILLPKYIKKNNFLVFIKELLIYKELRFFKHALGRKPFSKSKQAVYKKDHIPE